MHMDLWRIVLEALDSLASNKVRSALTVLGIVIGVGAVIAMLAIGAGAQNTITGSISGIGTNLLFVMRGGSEDVRNPQPLTLGDAEAMRDPFAAPSVIGVAPVLQGSAEITFAGEGDIVGAVGVTPEHASVRNVEIAEGEFINEIHVLGRSAVVVLGPDVAETLFDRTESIVGESVRIEGQPFRVIGVTIAKGGQGPSNDDNQIYIPMSTAQTRLFRRSGSDHVDMILVQALNADAVTTAEEEISAILRNRHRTDIGEDDFTTFSQQRLVSVTERTREIGLRKAVGARKRDIMLQFLAESALLSLFGGLIGIVLGWALSMLVGAIAAASNADINPVVGLDAVLMATIFSAAVGLFFGLYPAKRAADLEPVEALRYE
jgi:putative ABC transport system permease protein